MNNMRRGFTMIELIFVIVIIGILAAVAIPKLSATRDDAKISSELTSVAQVINNLGSEYTAKGKLPTASVTTANSSSNCFTIAAEDLTEGNVSVTSVTKGGKCDGKVYDGVIAKAIANGTIDTAGTKKYYKFGGEGVEY